MDTVRYVTVGAVAELVLDRPDKLNAVNDAMAAEIRECVSRAQQDGARALVVRGEGRGFCAGRDLADAEPGTEDAEAILVETFNPVLRELAELPIPTFAAVHGPALGVGLGLALACDVVFVADDAKLGSPFARIGAVLDSGGHWYFVDRLGPHRALELVYTGRLLSGREAAEWGLVNRALPAGELLDAVQAMATRVAEGPTTAFRLSKQLIRRLDAGGIDLAGVLEAEAAAQGEASRTEDYASGISAFQEKRTPTFSGR